jgi:hypothetical protein
MDDDLELRLGPVLTALAFRVPHDPELAATVRSRVRRQRRREAAVVAAVVAVLLIPVAVLLVRGGGTGRRSAPPATATTVTCPDRVPVAVLPAWAREGFTGSEPTATYVLGEQGNILGVVFGDPLTVPPSTDHQNKILWVTRADSGPLQIRATLAGSGRSTTITLPAPGPSIIDLPAPGCWRLDLRWGSFTDSMNLRYAPG